jgi:DNA repair protein RadB
MPQTISTGVDFIDDILHGGYERGVVTTLYGPSSSGKTNLCLLAAVSVARQGKQVIIIDTEGGVSIDRLKQIAPDHKHILKRLMFFTPVNFSEQCSTFESLKTAITPTVGLIIVDTISLLYRLELGTSENVYDINSALGRQLAYLAEITRRKGIPVLVVSQVYADFDNRDHVKMVGGDLLKYGSKCLIELRKADNVRSFIVRKHRFIPEGTSVNFRIVENGIERVA